MRPTVGIEHGMIERGMDVIERFDLVDGDDVLRGFAPSGGLTALPLE